MKEDKMKHELPTKEALLAGRRFEELSEAEKATYGEIFRRAWAPLGQEIADNLNRNAKAR